MWHEYLIIKKGFEFDPEVQDKEWCQIMLRSNKSITPISEQWYFVTKIVLTYYEKKML